MSIEYTHNAKNIRVQLEYIQIFPSRKEVHLSGLYFDKAIYDMRPFNHILTPSDLGVPGKTVISDLLTKAYTWFSNQENFDAIVDPAYTDVGYTKPDLIINES